jgi:hypothetical protein
LRNILREVKSGSAIVPPKKNKINQEECTGAEVQRTPLCKQILCV